MKLKALKEEMEWNMVRETVTVARWLNQSIEYVLDMGIDAYNYVVDMIVEENEEAKRENTDLPTTIGG